MQKLVTKRYKFKKKQGNIARKGQQEEKNKRKTKTHSPGQAKAVLLHFYPSISHFFLHFCLYKPPNIITSPCENSKIASFARSFNHNRTIKPY